MYMYIVWASLWLHPSTIYKYTSKSVHCTCIILLSKRIVQQNLMGSTRCNLQAAKLLLIKPRYIGRSFKKIPIKFLWAYTGKSESTLDTGHKNMSVATCRYKSNNDILTILDNFVLWSSFFWCASACFHREVNIIQDTDVNCTHLVCTCGLSRSFQLILGRNSRLSHLWTETLWNTRHK